MNDLIYLTDMKYFEVFATWSHVTHLFFVRNRKKNDPVPIPKILFNAEHANRATIKIHFHVYRM